jgi:stage II sporulation protein D
VPTNTRGLSLRLAAFEGKHALSISGAAGGDLNFRREGGSIRCSNGVSREHFTLRPELRTLTLGDRSYPGAIKVSLHPEGGLRAEAQLDLEAYVRGVVAGELPLLRALPAELEAQAVAARSYAITRWHERSRAGRAPYLWDDTRDQVYQPPQPAQSSALREAYSRLDAAISTTRGEVLIFRGELFDSRYHAACGGETSPLSSIPGSASAPCIACKGETALDLEWSFTATPGELSEVARALGLGDRLVVVEPARAPKGGRWSEVHLIGKAGPKIVPVGRLRALLGAERFASNLVMRTWPHPGNAISSGLRIDGRGRGHGVGMCQEGAHGLAERGWNKTRILAHYYPGTSTQSWNRVTTP